MTIVELPMKQTWLSSLNDPDISIQVRKKQRQETDGITGQVVDYGGRSVAESTSERKRSTPLTLYFIDGVPDAEQLRRWILDAEPLLVRDNLNWHRTGVIFSTDIDDLQSTNDRDDRLLQLDVTFQDIDWDFSV